MIRVRRQVLHPTPIWCDVFAGLAQRSYTMDPGCVYEIFLDHSLSLFKVCYLHSWIISNNVIASQQVPIILLLQNELYQTCHTLLVQATLKLSFGSQSEGFCFAAWKCMHSLADFQS